MAFGIGINTSYAEAGAVKGTQKEVACQCWFTKSGTITPLMLKVQDEAGEIQVIHQIEVHSREKKMYAGVPSIEFDCTLGILGQAVRAKLIFYQTENRWILNFR